MRAAMSNANVNADVNLNVHVHVTQGWRFGVAAYGY